MGKTLGEKKWNINASNLNMNNQATAQSENAPKEKKTKFDVHLIKVGVKKIELIKLVREVTKLSLKESKGIVDNLPKVLKKDLSEKDAKELEQKAKATGAIVEIK